MKRTIKPTSGVKDDTGSYLPVAPPEAPKPLLGGDPSLDEIHARQLLILQRETSRLTEKSAYNLLSKEEGVAFERCVKILREFKKEEREYLASLEDSELPDEDNVEGS